MAGWGTRVLLTPLQSQATRNRQVAPCRQPTHSALVAARATLCDIPPSGPPHIRRCHPEPEARRVRARHDYRPSIPRSNTNEVQAAGHRLCLGTHGDGAPQLLASERPAYRTKLLRSSAHAELLSELHTGPCLTRLALAQACPGDPQSSAFMDVTLWFHRHPRAPCTNPHSGECTRFSAGYGVSDSPTTVQARGRPGD